MSDLVPVYVRPDVSLRLEKLALLAGSVSNAIERLISHWEANATSAQDKTKSAAPPTQSFWKSSSGDLLPIGAKLEGPYKGKTFHAIVERGGIRYDGELHASPTAAARAVKRKMGLRGPSTSTDGRTFWKLRDPSSGRLVTIGALSPSAPIDVAQILKDLKSPGSKNAT